MELVDVYQVLAHVLGVAPRPHNGTWSTVCQMLFSPATGGVGAVGSTGALTDVDNDSCPPPSAVEAGVSCDVIASA